MRLELRPLPERDTLSGFGFSGGLAAWLPRRKSDSDVTLAVLGPSLFLANLSAGKSHITPHLSPNSLYRTLVSPLLTLSKHRQCYTVSAKSDLPAEFDSKIKSRDIYKYLGKAFRPLLPQCTLPHIP